MKDFDIIFATTGGGPSRATQTLALLVYEEAFQFFRLGVASAIGVLLLAACAVLAWLSIREASRMTRAELLEMPPAHRRQRWLLLLIALVLMGIALFPLYWIVLTSMTPTAIMLSRHSPLLPPFGSMSIDAYFAVFTRKPLLTWIGNSVVVTLGTLVITLTAGAMAGYSLSRYRTAAQRAMGFGLLASKMLPGALIVIPFFILFSLIGLIETWTGVMLANSAVAVPFATWLLKGFFDAIPANWKKPPASTDATS